MRSLPAPAMVRPKAEMSAAALTKPTSNSKSEASIATTIGCASDEYRDLEGAFGRRALTERAKGILMECHSIDEVSAFEMLRHQSRVSTASSSISPRRWSMATAYSPSNRQRLNRLSGSGVPGQTACAQTVISVTKLWIRDLRRGCASSPSS